MIVQCAVCTWIIVVIDSDWQLLRILNLKLPSEVHCESDSLPSGDLLGWKIHIDLV